MKRQVCVDISVLEVKTMDLLGMLNYYRCKMPLIYLPLWVPAFMGGNRTHSCTS